MRGVLQPDTDMEALFAGLVHDKDGSVTLDEIELDPGTERWIAPYHQDSTRVVDPIGGGNTFLGGMAVALARGHSLDDAAAWGSVAASFAIEQVGMPHLTGKADGTEIWNGESVRQRLQAFRSRLRHASDPHTKYK